jgi:DsbC/DsbD-like thiol-disulfide interchange protein
MTKYIVLFVALLVMPLADTSGQARPGQNESIGTGADHTKWTVRSSPAVARPGDGVVIVVEAEIADGWKMYAMDSPAPTRGVRINFGDETGLFRPAESIAQARPSRGFDPNFRMEVTYFERQAWFRVPGVVGRPSETGQQTLQGKVTFMLCNDRLCLPPATVALSAPLNIRP